MRTTRGWVRGVRSAHGRVVWRVAVAIALCAPVAAPSAAGASADEDAPPASGIVEQTGKHIPLDVAFRDETGARVTLGDIVDRPTILAPVYFECPSICRPLLGELEKTVEELVGLGMRPGEDFRVVSLSFDDRDTPGKALRVKHETLGELESRVPDDFWHFLTGDSASIARVLDAAGFYVQRNATGFAHPTSLIVLAADGKITRYLLGAEYLPVDVKMALFEAKQGRVGPTITRFFRFCFNYDPEGRHFVLNVTRLVGMSTVLGVVGLLVFLRLSGPGRKRKVG